MSIALPKHCISIVQFNILASNLAAEKFFPYVKPCHLTFDQRRHLLLSQVKTILQGAYASSSPPAAAPLSDASSPSPFANNLTTESRLPEIVCLEELSDYSSFFQPAMASLGYSSAYVKRPSVHASSRSGVTKHDGCGVFFLHSRFTLLYQRPLVFADRHDRVACLVILYDKLHGSVHQEDKEGGGEGEKVEVGGGGGGEGVGSSPYLMVANTHLYWDAGKQEDQLAELRELEQAVIEAHQWFKTNIPSASPVLPSSPASLSAPVNDYTDKKDHMKEGDVKKAQHTFGLPLVVCGDFNNTPSSLIYSFMTNTFLAAAFPHLRMKSAYQHYLTAVAAASSPSFSSSLIGSCQEPSHTTVTDKRCHTIDYIFFSQPFPSPPLQLPRVIPCSTAASPSLLPFLPPLLSPPPSPHVVPVSASLSMTATSTRRTVLPPPSEHPFLSLLAILQIEEETQLRQQGRDVGGEKEETKKEKKAAGEEEEEREDRTKGGVGGIPNSRHGSDHVPLLAVFSAYKSSL